MKIAQCADVHLGIGYPGPTPDARFKDICNVLDFMAGRIIEEKCDLVLVAGDLFKDARVFLDRASAFSPLFIGVIGATPYLISTHSSNHSFQSPIHRGDRCNLEGLLAWVRRIRLSVPYSSG